jgi:hypothetical protein
MDKVQIYYGKGYVVRVWKTDGFVFNNSLISDAGIIGIYVGHYKFGPSSNVVIDNSIIAHSRTNGIALQGVSDALISHSVLSGNHWHGLWGVPNVPNGITTGGQLYVGDGRNIRVIDNIIANGACGNCKPAGQVVGPVEVGDIAPPPAGVFGLEIEGNLLLDGVRHAIRHNPGTAILDEQVTNNRAVGFSVLDSESPPAFRSQNDLEQQVIPSRFKQLNFSPAAGSWYSGAEPNDRFRFHFSPAPRLGAQSSLPIFRCRRASDTLLLSTDPTCGGNGEVDAVIGFSYEPAYPNSTRIFECNEKAPRSRFFLSTDQGCQGETVKGALGYAIIQPD